MQLISFISSSAFRSTVGSLLFKILAVMAADTLFRINAVGKNKIFQRAKNFSPIVVLIYNLCYYLWYNLFLC